MHSFDYHATPSTSVRNSYSWSSDCKSRRLTCLYDTFDTCSDSRQQFSHQVTDPTKAWAIDQWIGHDERASPVVYLECARQENLRRHAEEQAERERREQVARRQAEQRQRRQEEEKREVRIADLLRKARREEEEEERQARIADEQSRQRKAAAEAEEHMRLLQWDLERMRVEKARVPSSAASASGSEGFPVGYVPNRRAQVSTLADSV